MAVKETILKAVSATVHQFDLEAEIILYGSQARGDTHAESDWDFLVLTDKEDLAAFKKKVRRELYFLEVQQAVVISTVIERKSWLKEMTETPFCKAVKKDGVAVV